MKKILTVLGARPQFIKSSVVSSKIRSSRHLDEVLVHTGQHFDANMSDVFFESLGLSKPSYTLGIGGGCHGAMTGRMLEQVENIILLEKPNVVLVYGDTNSTLAGALAAAKLNIPIAHVEAGLRSCNLAMPEEINRILTDRISSWLFTPTIAASKLLLREGVDSRLIHQVGDVMYDVALHYGGHSGSAVQILSKLGLSAQNYVLATIHRAENTNDVKNLNEIIENFIVVSSHMPLVWPLHPRTRKVLQDMGKLERVANKVLLIDPVGYLEMIQLERNAAVIATDSGGVQKEAFFYKVPCVTLRCETEWTELIEAGWNRLVPPSNGWSISDVILESMGSVGADIQPYGDGNAAGHIVSSIIEGLVD